MEQEGLLRAGQAAWRVTLDDVRRRFPRSEAASLRPDKVRGDHDLNPGFGPPDALREAAVLVPLVDRVEGPTVIFTQRTAHLTAHAGQISFPGGRRETYDHSPEDTALRETEEEIGLPRERIEILGRLDTYVTRTGFRVTPVVGMVRPPIALVPDPTEVEEVFEVPLTFILDPDNPKRHSREFMGGQRHFYVFPYQQRYIWGATAGMLVNLRDVLREAP
ncbi:CoA pyrophosphatase [Azospirillum sp. RWY-5-1]|uniref:CoA pyrophosphatase n=1 Tax=Azospirillum oleiclasticum TaxID=2735135 RepID=A0ABX2T3X6_9PROT|nr:CoA pyrophosphatase [Azospirillum oleiclasticum]NYZ11841.1 CoA pyrophosphatase [Azospirillum oleiclasticum]NYZ19001.1 CoA pyrophosphatase [Azospirillum oleiclasticum]